MKKENRLVTVYPGRDEKFEPCLWINCLYVVEKKRKEEKKESKKRRKERILFLS